MVQLEKQRDDGEERQSLAVFAILIWPILALLVFASLPVALAIIWAVLIPYLFLPEAFSIPLPGVPNLDKTAVITLGLVGGFVAFRGHFKTAFAQMATRPAFPVFRTLMLLCLTLMVIGPVLTVINNREVLVFGGTVLPPMRPWDIVSLIGQLALFLVPFLFARRYLTTPDMHRTLLSALVVSALGYSLLMLVEMRLSPQLHYWVYGFHQHSFAQHIRGGYRPKVFLQHGLWVGFFVFSATIAAVALWKCRQGQKWLWAGFWLFVVLAFSKNLGALFITILMLAVLIGLWPRMNIRIAAVIAICVLLYPGLRQADLIPTAQITAAVESISPGRAASLQFRLDNEDQLLARAYLKRFTGWGGWGRDRIYTDRGRESSISEGLWIQTLGAWGWIGYVGLFGLLTLPVIALLRLRHRKEIPIETIALTLISAGNLIYMIPNATLTPVGLLVFGALAGFVQSDCIPQPAQETAQTAPGHTSRYTRFPGPPTVRSNGMNGKPNPRKIS